MMSFVYLGCKQDYGELDTIFELLEENSSDDIVKQFKDSDLDSAIINNSKYNVIFVDAANIVMSDSTASSNIKLIFNSHGIDLVGKEVKWTIVAAFHKYLNRDKYSIPQLLGRMIEMSDSIYDKKYGYLRKENSFRTD